MESKYAIVIGRNGDKIEFVFVDFIEQDKEIREIPQYHVIQDGESLV